MLLLSIREEEQEGEDIYFFRRCTARVQHCVDEESMHYFKFMKTLVHVYINRRVQVLSGQSSASDAISRDANGCHRLALSLPA